MLDDERETRLGRLDVKYALSSTGAADTLSVYAESKLASETVMVMYPGLCGWDDCDLEEGRMGRLVVPSRRSALDMEEASSRRGDHSFAEGIEGEWVVSSVSFCIFVCDLRPGSGKENLGPRPRPMMVSSAYKCGLTAAWRWRLRHGAIQQLQLSRQLIQDGFRDRAYLGSPCLAGNCCRIAGSSVTCEGD